MTDEGLIIARKFKVGKRIGGGSFGEIYSGIAVSFLTFVATDMQTKQELAVKLVKISAKRVGNC